MEYLWGRMTLAKFSDKKLHKIERISQTVQAYFAKNKSVMEIPAKDLMPNFIEKGIFLKDHRNGLYIRNVLRDLDAAGKLSLLKSVKVIRKPKNRNWFFTRP